MVKKRKLEPDEILKLSEEGWTLRRIAEAAGVSPGYLGQIRNRALRTRERAASSYARSEIAERILSAIWVVYDRPSDYLEGFIARRFEPAGNGYWSPMGDTRIGDLEAIRSSFARAGLVKICRQDGDAPHIVETWL